MSTLFIQDTTLTAIADAIRAKGSSALAPTVKVVRTPNTWGFGENDFRAGSVIGIDNVNGASSYEVTIEGAAKLKIKLSWALKGNQAYAGGTLKVWSGKITDATSTYIVNNDVYKKINAQEYECNGDTVSFATTWNSNHHRLDADIYGFYAEVTGYDANGNQICNGNPLKEIYYSEGYYETGGIPANTALNKVITIPGATKLEFIDYSYYSLSTCQMGYSAGVKEAPTGFQSNLHCDTVISSTSNRGKSYLLENTDTITVNAWCKNGQTANHYGIYFEVIGYDADGNVILDGGAPSTYTPLEMPAAILAISGEGGGGITPEGELEILENGDYDVTTYASAHVAVPVGIFPQGTLDIRQNGNYDCADYQNVYVDVPSSGGVEIDPVVLTGTCDSACSGAMATAFIKNFPNKVSTNSITGATQMFYQTVLEEIPFDLNFNSSATIIAQNMFAGANNLKKIPKFNNMKPRNLQNIFKECWYLREIPEDWCDTWDWYTLHSTTQGNCVAMFNYCQSLRKVPEKVLKELYASCTASYYSQFNGIFYRCSNLDEIRGLNFDESKALTSNMFVSSPFEYLYCLKHFTFATNEDGTPKTANWKNQTIDLSYYVGYMAAYSLSETESFLKNSGRTTAKCIYNQETYRALKDDPDAYVWGDSTSAAPWEYAFYNKAAAVETINSLPDCSASGGTNTIRFFGVAGSATDEGAINTMTEAEIAVAAAKGWTVTYKV